MKLSRPYYLCKSDRVVVLFLLAVLAFGVIGYHLLWPSADTTPIAAADSTLSKRGAVGTDSRRAYTYATPSRQVVYAPFDPNTADSTQLLSLGLQPYQVRSIYHYRAKGGVYRRPSDFARLYGLTAKQYRELEPYIRISADYLPASEVYAVHDERPKASSDSLRYPVKLRNSERVALNLADTTLLRRVPGIGAYYAAASSPTASVWVAMPMPVSCSRLTTSPKRLFLSSPSMPATSSASTSTVSRSPNSSAILTSTISRRAPSATIVG